MSEDIFQRLREDHRRVLGELDDLERATGARSTAAGVSAVPAALEQARELVALLERQFETHMAAEGEVLFPALARDLDDGPALVSTLYEEHDELKAMLAALADTLRQPQGPPRDEQVVVQIRDLTDLLRIHIRKEETLVFGVAERVLDPRQRAELAARRLPEAGQSRPGDSHSPPKGPPV